MWPLTAGPQLCHNGSTLLQHFVVEQSAATVQKYLEKPSCSKVPGEAELLKRILRSRGASVGVAQASVKHQLAGEAHHAIMCTVVMHVRGKENSL